MRLRDMLNESKVGKFVNDTSIGRYFENSDFAKALEWPLYYCSRSFNQKGVWPKIRGVSGGLIMPLFPVIAYPLLKVLKRLSPKTYKEICFDLNSSRYRSDIIEGWFYRASESTRA